MDKIITDWQVKQILGVSDSSQDTLVDMWNEMATEQLAHFLNLTDFASHSITDERVKIHNCEYLMLNDFPIDLTETFTIKDRDRQTVTILINPYIDPDGRRVIRFKNDSDQEQNIFYDELLISYTAGWRTKDQLTLVTNPSENDTLILKYEGTETTYTFKASVVDPEDIMIGGDTEATLTNIANKISGATASSTTVTFPLGYKVISTTLANDDDTILNSNLPAELKQAVAFLVGGGVAEKNKKGGIASYTIGSKTVSFRDSSEGNFAMEIIKKYANFYKKTELYI